MIVFYDSTTGAVTSTVSGTRVPERMNQLPHVVLPNPVDMGELRAWSVVNGELVLSDLSPVREQAIAEINQMSGAKRVMMITDIPGQEMIYLRKEEEARAYLTDAAPSMANYPMLNAETGVTAPDAYSLAQVWLNMSELLRQTAALLEKARMQAINSVTAAQSPAEIEAVLAFYRTI